jgi:hypothetical protein
VQRSSNHHQQPPSLDRCPGWHADLADVAGPAGRELVLHLHRFDHDERLAGGDGIAWRDEDAQDLAWHRGDDALLARGTAVIDMPARAPAVDDERYDDRPEADEGLTAGGGLQDRLDRLAGVEAEDRPAAGPVLDGVEDVLGSLDLDAEAMPIAGALDAPPFVAARPARVKASMAAASIASVSAAGDGSRKGRPSRRTSSASRLVVSNSPAANASVPSSHWKNGMVVVMPRISYSESARRMRATACGRFSPQAASFEIIES